MSELKGWVATSTEINSLEYALALGLGLQADRRLKRRSREVLMRMVNATDEAIVQLERVL